MKLAAQIAIGLLAIVATAVAAVALTTALATSSKLTAARRQLATADAQSAALEQRVAALEQQPTATNITDLQHHLSNLESCLPEIQTELNGLSITGTYYGTSTSPPAGFAGQVAGWPLSLSYGEQLSPQCQGVLQPGT